MKIPEEALIQAATPRTIGGKMDNDTLFKLAVTFVKLQKEAYLAGIAVHTDDSSKGEENGVVARDRQKDSDDGV